MKRSTNPSGMRYHTQCYTIKDFYDSYYNQIDPETVYNVGYTKFRAVVEDYFKHIAEEVVENSKVFNLPSKMGYLSVVKHQPKSWTSKSLSVDFELTKKYNKTIYHMNEHSHGYKFRFLWSKKWQMLTYKSHYRFLAARDLKRRLAEIIKNKEHDYITL